MIANQCIQVFNGGHGGRDRKVAGALAMAKRRFAPFAPDDPIWLTARRYTTKRGYVVLSIYMPEHKKSCCKMEHVWLWERFHYERLPSGWVVHHRNEQTDDNGLNNLVAMPRGLHKELHVQLRYLAQQYSGLEYVVRRHRLTEEFVRRITELDDLRSYWRQQ